MAIEEEKKGDPSKSLSAHAKDKETTTTTTTTKRIELLDEDDELTDAFVIALAQTFIRFSKNAKSVIIAGSGSASSIGKTDDENNNNKGNTQQAEKFRQELKQAVLTEEDLDNFARAVNQGNTMSDEEKTEIKEYFETDKDGRLTFNGFCEMYHLQSTSQEDESWKDLHALGYDDQLQLRPDKLSSDDKEKVAQPKIAE